MRAPAAADSPEPPAAGATVLVPGQLVDHFRVVRLLGHGGMGKVYLARDTRLGRKVALKVIHSELFEQSQDHLERLLREARATAQFNHPNIVTLYVVGEHQGLPYLALEHLEGETLQQRLQREGFSLPGALRAALAIARALSEAHRHGILHCDLKPSNVMIPRDGRLRVLDFGLAGTPHTPPSEDPEGQVGATSETLPLDRQLRGTPAYMAPEQWTGGELTGAVDVWAWGVILYELLTGRCPYSKTELRALRRAICEQPVPFLAELRNVPVEVARLVTECLEKEPTKRPTAVRLEQRLLQLIGREEEPGSEESPFRGLFPFEESHARLFFGRDDEIAAVLERLRGETVLPVIGPSGAGKSSFVQAGLIPRLREQGPLVALQLRPGSDPFLALVSRLHGAQDRPSGEATVTPFGVAIRSLPSAEVAEAAAGEAEETRRLARRLQEQPHILTLILQRLAEQRRASVLLFVDQLEEVHTLVPDLEQRRRFMAAVCGAADEAAIPVRVVFTLREEFLSRLAEAPEARAALSHIQMLRSPEPPALREILVRPLEALGYGFDDPTLPEEMVQGLSAEAASLPLLQFAAQQLWAGRDRERHLLLRARYQEMGGVAGALARHADGVLFGLPPEEMQLARRMLLGLITPEGTRCTRTRRLALEQLPVAAAPVLDRLINNRLLTEKSGGPEAGGEPALELVHESLVATWSTLRGWIEESREELVLRAELERAEAHWDHHGRRHHDLLSGEDLAQARRLTRAEGTSLPERLARFVAASERRARRRQQRRRGALVLAFALLASVALLFAAKERETRRARERAESGQAEALREGARSALARGDLLEARARLRAALEVEDSVEARLLWGQLRRDPLHGRRALSSFLYAAAYSPSGELVAVAGADHAIYLVEVRSQAIRSILRGHADQVFSLAFTPDGRQLVSGTWGGELWTWPLHGRGAPRPLVQAGSPIWALAVSPDGRTLAAGRDEGGVWLHDLLQGRAPRRLAGHTARVHGVSFSPDGRTLASSSADGTVRLWRLPRGDQLALLRGHTGRVRDVAFSPDGRRLASAGADATVRLWEVPGGRPVRILHGHTAPVYSALFSRDGKRLTSGGEDAVVRIWDAEGGQELQQLAGHTGRIFRLCLSPDGARLASVSGDTTLRLWDLRPRGVLPRRQSSIVDHVSFSPDGRTVAAAVRQGVALWDVRDGRQRALLRGHSGGVLAAEFSPDGRMLASASWDGTARIYDLATGATRLVLRGHSAAVRRAVFSPGGEVLVTASTDGGLRLWRTSDGELQRVLTGHTEPVMDARFSPDGALLASASYDGTIRLWPLSSPGAPRVLRGHQGAVNRLAFDPDGGLFSVGADGSLRRWDLEQDSSRALLRADRRLTGLALRPDGQRLVYAGPGGAVLVDGQLHRLARLAGHRLDANEVALSPDGKLCATGGGDQTVRLFETESGRPHWWARLLLAQPPLLFTHRGALPLEGGAVPPGASRWQRLAERAVLASQHATRGTICLFTQSGDLELWDQPGEHRLAAARLADAAEDLLALPASCLVRGRAGGVLLLSGARQDRLVERGASAIAEDDRGLLVAVESQIRSFDLDGRAGPSYACAPGATAILRLGDRLLTGYREGNIESQPIAGPGPRLTFEEIASSPVLRIAPGPAGSVVASFADGLLGIWSPGTGRRLDWARLHGPPLHLRWTEAGQLLAASELGDYLVWDQRVLARSACEVLREVWSEVPLLWRDGAALPAVPPTSHPCFR